MNGATYVFTPRVFCLLLPILFLLGTAESTLAQPAPEQIAAIQGAVEGQVRAGRSIVKEFGVHIVDVESGEPVYNHQANRSRILASNTKLFTTAAALDVLGPGFVFETPIVAAGEVREGTLDGPVAILGSGDPNLSGRHHFGDSFAIFRRWAWALRGQGIQRVTGDIYLVNGLFEGAWVHPDWPKDQLTRWYEAPVDSLSFNDNCVLVRVWPGRRVGERARIEVVPPVPLFEVTGNLRTIASARQQWVKIDRELGTNKLTVNGRIYLRADPVEKWVAVEDPVQYFGAALRQAMAEEGVVLEGKLFRADALPQKEWRPVDVYRSDLLTTLEVINKRSQNFYAESLLKGIGARHCGRGDWLGGLQGVREFAERMGLETEGLHLADGSGMSRNNRATARQLTALLRAMYFHRWGKEFLRTLPYSGEPELRWSKRLAEPPYRGNVFAKTGTLNGVSALSGYAKGKSGRLYAFSILCNGTRSNWEAVRVQDRIVRALIDQG